MDLEFTEEQEQLRASVRDVLSRECPPPVVRALAERGEYPETLWKRMVELDWPILALDEGHGGVGFGFTEMAVVAEELGRAAAPSPFEAVATQYQPMLAALGAPVTPGRTGTLAVAEHSGWWSHPPTTTARASGDGWIINGAKRWVFDAGAVDEILVVAACVGGSAPGSVGVFSVEAGAPGLAIAPVRSFDATRRLAHVTFTDVEGNAAGAATSDVRDLVDGVLDEAAVVIALETVGTCHALFDLTREYAKNRQQFGVAIGSFQAIKHKLADMFIALERARVTAYYAALAIAEDDPRRRAAASMAKAAAGDAQRTIAQESIQIHGGIGYTWEHDLHLFVKRAKGGDALFGTAAEHRARLATHLVTTGSN